MEIKNFRDLEEQKNRLRSEISEMESIMSFKSPRKSINVLTKGASEQYLGRILDSQLSKNIFPLAEKFLEGTIQMGSINLLKNTVGKKITKPMLVKGIVGLGVLATGVFLAKKAKQKIDEYQQRKVSKSLNELI